MKHLFTLTLLIAFTQIVFSQSACDNFEKAKQIKASADLKHHGTLKQIELYWSKRCACESGSITGGTWDFTVEVANRVYDGYKDGSVTRGYTGPSFPVPDKKITVNDCNNDNNFNINPDISDCKPNTFDKTKDPQQYGNAFMLARCECEKGVPNEERAKQLEATMKINFQNAQTYYGNTLGMPQPMKWTECPIIQFGGIQSNESTQTPAPTLIYTGHESDLDKLKDQYLETFSESGSYNSYVAGENIKRLGVSMAKDYADNLKSIGQLIETTDPAALQKDYMDKMRNIENLEATFNAESNSYFFQSGQQLGNSINNNDYESAMFQAGGLLNAHLERKEAEKELAKQKAELERAKKKQMRALYEKARDFNQMNRKNFLKLAAFSSNASKEQYYLQMVDHCDCYQKSLWSGYLSDNPNWLDNNCPVPKYKESNLQQNNLVSKDVSLSKLAEKRYDYFIETGHNEYRDAAISFASAAITEKPKSQYFAQVGKYYTNYSNVLALGNFMAAKEYGSLRPENQIIVDSLTPVVQEEIKLAIIENNIAYLNSFLKVGLDDVIRVEKMDLLQYSIHLDQADAMQSILNSRVAAMTDKQKTDLIQKLVFLSVLNNSKLCIQRFVDIGLPIDFKRNKKHPIDLANEVLSEDAFQILMKNTAERGYYENKYKNSPIHALTTINNDPSNAEVILDKLDQEKDLARVVSRMVDQFDEKPNYVIGVGESPIAKAYIKSSEATTLIAKQNFIYELLKPYTHSVSALYLEKGIIEFEHIPSLQELGILQPLEYICFGFNNHKKDRIIRSFDRGSDGLYIPHYDTTAISPNENLAYITWLTKNPIVFHQLDDLFDFSNILCSDGNTLFYNMIKSLSFTNTNFTSYNNYHKINSKHMNNWSPWLMIEDRTYAYIENGDTAIIAQGITNKFAKSYSKELIFEIIEEHKFLTQYESDRKLFYSNDFDFKKKIDDEWPIFVFSNTKREFGDNYLLQFELYEIIKNYQLSSDQKSLNNDGGSIIHWYLKQIVESNEFHYPDPNFLKSINTKLDVTNDLGQTAWEYYSQNKKHFNKKYTMRTFVEADKTQKGYDYYILMGNYFPTLQDWRDRTNYRSDKNDANLYSERQWAEIVLGK